MPEMTNEHREFLAGLNHKTEVQVEHVAGCEQCFNFYLFGQGYRCKEYPAKHRIKHSVFARLIKDMPVGDLPTDDLRTAARLLAGRFNDPSITDDAMDEVTIVPDDEWTMSDILSDAARSHGMEVSNVGLSDLIAADLRGVPKALTTRWPPVLRIIDEKEKR